MVNTANASNTEIAGLKKAIVAKGAKKGWLATQIGLTDYTFSRKLHGRVGYELSQDEFESCAKALGFDAAYVRWLGEQSLTTASVA